jgi:hypothetical protein
MGRAPPQLLIARQCCMDLTLGKVDATERISGMCLSDLDMKPL